MYKYSFQIIIGLLLLAIGFSTYLIIAEDGSEHYNRHSKSHEIKTKIATNEMNNEVTVYVIPKIKNDKANKSFTVRKSQVLKSEQLIKELNENYLNSILKYEDIDN